MIFQAADDSFTLSVCCLVRKDMFYILACSICRGENTFLTSWAKVLKRQSGLDHDGEGDRVFKNGHSSKPLFNYLTCPPSQVLASLQLPLRSSVLETQGSDDVIFQVM